MIKLKRVKKAEESENTQKVEAMYVVSARLNTKKEEENRKNVIPM
jgi:hypothetical protein